MNMFKGYIPSNGKTPLLEIKNRDNWLDNPPEEGDYVGVLRDDVIQLDFDNEEDTKIALQIVDDYKLRCNVLKTTRGVHLYFINDNVKSQSVDVFNTIGLSCDIGLGSKWRVVPLRTTKRYQHRKIVNGIEVIEDGEIVNDREWLQTFDELEVVPPFFKPMGNTDYGFKTATDRGARNNTLFSYILNLQFEGYSKSEIRRIIKIINDYVLDEPLDDNEIDTITRDDAFSQELFFGERGKFLHDRFGDYMLSNCHIMYIDDQLCIYTRDNVYSNNQDDFERAMLDKIPSLTDRQRKEVYKYVVLKCTKKGKYSNPKYIGLRDYILDIETMEQFPYTPSFVINNKIDWNYNPNAYSETLDRTLDKVTCHDKEVRLLLEEMIGYSLYRENNMQMAFILTGGGSNGKSTILNIIKLLLGKQNYTSLDLRELEETFTPAELYGKLANIGDDISAKYLETSSVFKKVVTGESFMAQRKYGQPFELESYATQIFCANELPPVNDRTDGFSRRLNIIPFTAKFSPQDKDHDPFIMSKLETEESMEYLLKLAIEGLKRVLYNGKFTRSKRGEIEKRDFIKNNNPVLLWFEEGPKIKNESVNDVYMEYRVWCDLNGVNALKKANLSREIRKELGLVSKPQYVDGKTVRVYVEEE